MCRATDSEKAESRWHQYQDSTPTDYLLRSKIWGRSKLWPQTHPNNPFAAPVPFPYRQSART
jgi:hypothetical protein